MGASQTRSEHQYQELMGRTGFSLEQIQKLHSRFQHLSGSEETISRENLDSIPGLAENPIKKQIIEAFFDKRNQHNNETGSYEEIGFEQFVMVMSHFRPPNPSTKQEESAAIRKEKLHYFFSQTNNQAKPIPHQQNPPFTIRNGVLNHFDKTVSEGQVLFNMHDTDSDGIITLDEYRKVVEELLSKSGTIGQDAAKAIADAAMLEVASTNAPEMGPDDFYEGITFEHFEQMLQRLELESRMHIRFLDANTATMHCGNATM